MGWGLRRLLRRHIKGRGQKEENVAVKDLPQHHDKRYLERPEEEDRIGPKVKAMEFVQQSVQQPGAGKASENAEDLTGALTQHQLAFAHDEPLREGAPR